MKRLLAASLVAFAVLCLTAEERFLGGVADEQLALSTATALSEGQGLGVARGQFFSFTRSAGDAVSPYGMALPLLSCPVSFLSSRWEAVFGARSSQTLFVFFQILLITASALGAGLFARTLGAGAAGEWVAVLGTAIGSPLWAYRAALYSEPLQAACLVFAATFAAKPAPRYLLRSSVLAGLFAGLAVLGKGSNVLLLPWLVVPFAVQGDGKGFLRRFGAFVSGAAAPLLTFATFEVLRFGVPFASYGEQHFTHSFLDGLWRLLVGVNKGLLFYFPLLVLAAMGVAALVRDHARRGAGIAVAGIFGVLLVVSATWWAWDGTFGWGPRLLVPAIPLLAGAAGAIVVSRGTAVAGWLLVAAGTLVNALGVFQCEAVVSAYVSSAGPVEVSEHDSRRYPRYFVGRTADGRFVIPRDFVAGRDAAFSPLRLHAFLLRSRLIEADAEREGALLAPPWLTSHPTAVPHLSAGTGTLRAIQLASLSEPFHPPFLGRVLAIPRATRGTTVVGAYDGALADQALRLLDLGRFAAAGRIARRLFALEASGFHAALVAESLRGAGKDGELARFLASLPKSLATAPHVSVVEALSARDRRDEMTARGLLVDANRSLRRSTLDRVLAQPIAAWPDSLHGILLGEVRR